MTFRNYKIKHITVLFLLVCACFVQEASGQSVGIGTTSPNSKAALDIVSPANNQGVLLPRLTGGQRTSMSLGTTERGLIVYDTTDNLFYYWDGNQWIAGLGDTAGGGDVQNLAFNQATAMLSIDNGNTVDLSSLINDADADPSNELITDVRLNGNNLEIEENGLVYQIDLSPLFASFTDNQEVTEFQLGGTNSSILQLTLENDVTGQKTVDLHSVSFPATSDLSGTLGTAVIRDAAVTNAKIADVDPSKINQAGAVIGDLLRWDGSQWAPASTSIVSGISYYSIDPSDFNGVYRQNFVGTENNVIIFENDNSFVTIKDETLGKSIVAPVHLPHGATVQSITLYFMDMHGPPVKLSLLERPFDGSSVDLGGGLNVNENGPGIFSGVLNGPFIIDNQNNSYMISVEFNISGITSQVGDVEQGVYGVVIEYISP